MTSIGAMALVKLYFDAGGNVTIPEGVKSIGMGAFCTGESILHMTLPSSLTHIGEGAFQWCKSLREITIPSGVKVIADQTFWGCSALRSVTIQEGVTSIGEGAFWGCLKYKGSGSHSEITIPSSVTSIGARAFEGCEVEVVRVSSDEYIERLKQMLAASGLDVSKVRFEVIGQTDELDTIPERAIDEPWCALRCDVEVGVYSVPVVAMRMRDYDGALILPTEVGRGGVECRCGGQADGRAVLAER